MIIFAGKGSDLEETTPREKKPELKKRPNFSTIKEEKENP